MAEEGPSHLEVAGRSDLRVALQRFSKQHLRSFAITWRCAIHQHHCMEAAYLRPFETLRKGFCVLRRDLKVTFSGFPPMRRCRRDTRDGLCEAEGPPKRYRSGLDQFTSQRIKLRSLRLFAEHDEALNRRCQHQPRTHSVRLAATRQKHLVV